MNDRRRSRRVPCLIPASTDRGRVLIDDLSPRGAGVRARAAAEVGERIILVLRDPEGDAIRFKARVAHVRRAAEGFDVGCSFEEESTAVARVLLRRFATTIRRAPRPRKSRAWLYVVLLLAALGLLGLLA